MFTDWLRGHAVPLRELIGEHSHLIRELALLRQRLLRFLVERRGFTAVAFEYGFSTPSPSVAKDLRR